MIPLKIPEGAPIVKEAPAYCGDWWNVKIGNAAMLFGFNTNGDLNKQLKTARKLHLRESRMYS